MSSAKWLSCSSMYENARSRVGVGCNLNEEFSVKVDIHQGSWLSPLLFITVLEALSQEFCTGCPWENLYINDLVVITESLEELQKKLILRKTNMEGKGLRVNTGKTKVLISGLGLDMLQKSVKDGWLFQLCPQEMQWYLWPSESDPSFKSERCTGQASRWQTNDRGHSG